MVYPAIFFELENGAYSVLFPDLNNLATYGYGEEDSMNMARDCLSGYLEVLEEDGETVPAPSAVEDIKVEEWYGPEDVFCNVFVKMVNSSRQ